MRPAICCPEITSGIKIQRKNIQIAFIRNQKDLINQNITAMTIKHSRSRAPKHCST